MGIKVYVETAINFLQSIKSNQTNLNRIILRSKAQIASVRNSLLTDLKNKYDEELKQYGWCIEYRLEAEIHEIVIIKHQQNERNMNDKMQQLMEKHELEIKQLIEEKDLEIKKLKEKVSTQDKVIQMYMEKNTQFK